MQSLEFTAKEMAYLLISLRKYEEQLLSSETEDMEDAAMDLIFVQALIRKLKEAKSKK